MAYPSVVYNANCIRNEFIEGTDWRLIAEKKHELDVNLIYEY